MPRKQIDMTNEPNQPKYTLKADGRHYQSYCYACASIIPDGETYCQYHKPAQVDNPNNYGASDVLLDDYEPA